VGGGMKRLHTAAASRLHLQKSARRQQRHRNTSASANGAKWRINKSGVMRKLAAGGGSAAAHRSSSGVKKGVSGGWHINARQRRRPGLKLA